MSKVQALKSLPVEAGVSDLALPTVKMHPESMTRIQRQAMIFMDSESIQNSKLLQKVKVRDNRF